MIILSKSKLPEVIDLFSGCGGLALGFQMAGFRVTHGIELMENAVKNANYNLSIKRKEKGLHICGDITQLSESIFKNQIGPNGCIVIGGPPCQAYSLIGRAKLNSLMDDGSFLDDKRGFLFEDFLRFAIGLEAKAVVMENVKSCTAYGKLNVPEKVAEILETCGYTVYWTILNSADYGVPQIRERMILYAVKGDNVEPVLPKPTHSGKWFGGLYSGIGLTDLCNSGECRHFIMPRMRRKIQPRWLTVEEAIGDLPELHARAGSQYSPHSKPFEMKEVLARIEAVLRRSGSVSTEKKSRRLTFEKLTIDMDAFELIIDGKKVDTPPKEMELLYYLASSPNRVYTRNQLLDEVWGFDYFGDSRTVDVHVKRLREKLEVVNENWSLKTVWGVGYKFEVL